MIPGLLGRPAAGLASALLFDEEFVGTTQAYYEGRGWYDGTAGITAGTTTDGYQFLTDATLGRNVMFAHWALASTTGVGGPGTNGFAWRLALNTAQTGSGATVYLLWKTHNWIAGNQFGAHWVRFARGFGQFTSTNSNGQINLEIYPQSSDSTSQTLDTDTGLDWHAVFGGATVLGHTHGLGTSGGTHLAHLTNTLVDDQWYETAMYLLPPTGDGDSTGAIHVIYRTWGSSTWLNMMNGTNLNTGFFGPLGAGAPNINYFMIAPFISNTVRWTDDIRQYWGAVKLYAGDVTGLL